MLETMPGGSNDDDHYYYSTAEFDMSDYDDTIDRVSSSIATTILHQQQQQQQQRNNIDIILHAGWIFSVLLAVSCHWLHLYARKRQQHRISIVGGTPDTTTMNNDNPSFGNDDDAHDGTSQQQSQPQQTLLRRRRRGQWFCWGWGTNNLFRFLHVKIVDLFHSPILPTVAYITALEAISTDLFGFIPEDAVSVATAAAAEDDPMRQLPQHFQYYHDDDGEHHHRLLLLRCFCGNFGILLLNPSWLAIDGGRTALDILEKMINVTMMRGKGIGMAK